jgi:thymidylate synthase (FAD)
LRVFSFAVESTRYCNYSKNKFNNEVTYICPSWVENIPETFTISIKDDWGELFPEYYYDLTDLGKQNIKYSYNKDTKDFLWVLAVSEKLYLSLLEAGWKPQQARNVLPLATKCDMVMTGFMSDWNHFFDLRSNKYGTGGAHPQASELADSLYETLYLS